MKTIKKIANKIEGAGINVANSISRAVGSEEKQDGNVFSHAPQISRLPTFARQDLQVGYERISLIFASL